VIRRKKEIFMVKKNKKTINQIAKEVEDIYQDYLEKLNNLRDEQIKITENFVKEMEKVKLENIRKSL